MEGVKDRSLGPVSHISHELGQHHRSHTDQGCHHANTHHVHVYHVGVGHLAPQHEPHQDVDTDVDSKSQVRQTSQSCLKWHLSLRHQFVQLFNLGVMDRGCFLINFFLRSSSVRSTILLELVSEGSKPFVKWSSIRKFQTNRIKKLNHKTVANHFTVWLFKICLFETPYWFHSYTQRI